MNYKQEEVKFNKEGTGFIYNGDFYYCEHLTKIEKQQILLEAENSHKDEIENLYDKDSLKPFKAKLYLDENDHIVFLMVVYLIDYKDSSNGRTACGSYQPNFNIVRIKDKFVVFPHPYQNSICW